MTPLELLFQSVWNTSFWWVFWISLIAGVVMALLILAGGGRKAIMIAILFTFVACWLGSINATAQANNAVTAGWQGAINQKATQLQKLHGIFISYEKETYDCHYGTALTSGDNLGATGCVNATSHEVCLAYDKKGNCKDSEYDYYPDYAHEYSYRGTLNIIRHATISFGEHLSPPDGVPADWQRVKQSIDAGVPLGGSVYDAYYNWASVDDLTVYHQVLPSMQKMQKQGLLPIMPFIKSGANEAVTMDPDGSTNGVVGYNYQFVQYVGGLKVSPSQDATWQKVASEYAAMAGPQLQASVMVVFAPASDFPDAGQQYQWIRTMKAWLQQDPQIGHYLLPKNLVLLGCGVSMSLSEISWCRMETGMFTGNEGVEQDIAQLQPFPFTPESFFGQANYQAVPDPTKEVNTQDDVVKSIKANLNFAGGVVDAVLRNTSPNHGFHRVRMTSYLYMRTNITPDPSEVDGIKATAFWWTVLPTVILWLVILGITFGIIGQNNKSQYSYYN